MTNNDEMTIEDVIRAKKLIDENDVPEMMNLVCPYCNEYMGKDGVFGDEGHKETCVLKDYKLK